MNGLLSLPTIDHETRVRKFWQWKHSRLTYFAEIERIWGRLLDYLQTMVCIEWEMWMRKEDDGMFPENAWWMMINEEVKKDPFKELGVEVDK